MKKFYILFCIFALFSCSKKEEETEVTSQKKEEVVVALNGNPTTLDPTQTSETLTFQVTDSFYNSLLMVKPNGQIDLDLAQSYKFSDDHLTLSFTLKDNVYFHDGTKLDSLDVKASLERESIYKPYYEIISEFEIIDDLNFNLKLSSPSYSILYTLASNFAVIYPSEKIQNGHNFKIEPVGTGAYKFVEFKDSSYIKATSNENYFMHQVEPTDLTFRVVSDDSVILEGMLTGDLDIAQIYEKTNVEFLEKQNNFSFVKDLSNMVLVITFNTADPILSDENLRKAIASSINKKEVLEAVYGGGEVANTFIDKNSQYYTSYEPYPYDLEKAKEYLAKSNYKGEVIEITVPQNYLPHVNAGVIYQDMLKKVGINTSIKKVEWAYWISEVFGKGNFQMTVIGHTGKEDIYQHFQGLEYTHYNNPKVIEDVNGLNTDFDENSRKARIERILKAYADDLPFVYIGNPNRVLATSKNISGVYLNYAVDSFNLENIKYK